MKILLAADGSEFTKRAAHHLARHIGWFSRPEIHIFNVHAPLPYARAASVAGSGAVNEYHKEECEKALAVAETVLRDAKVPSTSAWVVGEVAPEIAKYVLANGIDLVVMGSHGHGQLRNLALGSVGDALLRDSKVPVMIIR